MSAVLNAAVCASTRPYGSSLAVREGVIRKPSLTVAPTATSYTIRFVLT